MQSISLNSPSFLSIPDSNLRPSLGRRKASVVVAAWRREAADQNFGGSTVDENMIVLRKRIHEMKMIEKNYEPPADWMDWEKRYYTSYDSMICEALGVLQTQLMNTRPSLALGMIALLALSVPTSSAFLLYHLVEMCKQIM
ncbi:hypothetical protein QN277_029251 [Acacia crassicarpa]|uniref:Mediator of RNA polymerase II transcription subunit n=1 Tax=Acacia crassicarpa TaxID=499986 RepID=A0AAE1J7F8_9FABA|nr:hypothetical protein QN277_029251 [Acacia crassicarpa]